MTLKHRSVAIEEWSHEVPFNWEGLQLAYLVRIYEVLSSIDRTLKCPSTQRIPYYLRQIAAAKRKRRK